MTEDFAQNNQLQLNSKARIFVTYYYSSLLLLR